MTLRELDREIAITIMGWRHGDKFLLFPPEKHVLSDFLTETPHFTSDPAASKQLREKAAERFDVMQLIRWGRNDDAGRPYYQCYVYDNRDDETIHHYHDANNCDTEELAVALCIARAYGIDTAGLE